jgi:hypothetical protein
MESTADLVEMVVRTKAEDDLHQAVHLATVKTTANAVRAALRAGHVDGALAILDAQVVECARQLDLLMPSD